MKFAHHAIAALTLSAGFAAAGILGPGSIAFTGFNADGLDNLAFVALQDLPAGTQISFTDNEWNGTGWTDNNESAWMWTALGAIPAGTIITIDDVNSTSTTSNLGTVSFLAEGGTNRGIANSNEAVFAFVGSYASPTAFLAAIGNDPVAVAGTTLSGTGLTEGLTALFIEGDEDIMAYIGLRNNQIAFDAYLAQINDVANWITQDGSGDQSNDGINPDIPFSNEAFVIPAPGPLALAGVGVLIAMRRRR